jgi:hypothetical protein
MMHWMRARTLLALVFLERREIIVVIFVGIRKPVHIIPLSVLVATILVLLIILLVVIVVVAVSASIFVAVVIVIRLPRSPAASLLSGSHRAFVIVANTSTGGGLIEALHELDDLLLLLVVRIGQLFTPTHRRTHNAPTHTHTRVEFSMRKDIAEAGVWVRMGTLLRARLGFSMGARMRTAA